MIRLIQQSFDSAFVQSLGWTLLHFLWQGAAIALVLAAALALLRRSSPQTRYAASCAALLAILMLPIVTFAILIQRPTSAIARESSGASLPTTPSVLAAAPAKPNAAEPSPKPLRPLPLDIADSRIAPQAVAPSDVHPAESRPHQSPPPLAMADRLRPIIPWLVACWLTGACALSIRLAGGWTRLQLLKRDASPHPWTARIADLSHRLGIRRVVNVLASARIDVPCAIGFLHPVILLPASLLAGIPGQQLEAILMHELAHIRRRDYLVNLLQSAIEALLFYHPAVWWISHRIRVERENCCDDIAADICGSRATYARALASVEELRARPTLLAPAATTGALLSRIRRLVLPPTPTHRATWWPASAIVLAALLAVGFGMRFAQGGNSPTTRPGSPDRSANAADFNFAAFRKLSDSEKVDFVLSALDARDRSLQNLDYRASEITTNTNQKTGAQRFMCRYVYEQRRLGKKLWLQLAYHNSVGKLSMETIHTWDGAIAKTMVLPHIGTAAGVDRREPPFFSEHRPLNELLGLRVGQWFNSNTITEYVRSAVKSGWWVWATEGDCGGTPSVQVTIRDSNTDRHDFWFDPKRGFIMMRAALTYTNAGHSISTELTTAEQVAGIWVSKKAAWHGAKGFDEQTEITAEIDAISIGSVKNTDLDVVFAKGQDVLDFVRRIHYRVRDDGKFELLPFTAIRGAVYEPPAISVVDQIDDETAKGYTLTLVDDPMQRAFEEKFDPLLERTLAKVRELGGKVDESDRAERTSVGIQLSGSQGTDENLKLLDGRTAIVGLTLNGTPVTDAGIEHIKRLKRLMSLSLASTRVTDAALGHLSGLKELWFLNLAKTQITDAGLIHLRDLPKLTKLNLSGTKITDVGLANLKPQNLDLLCLDGTKVTAAGLADLKGMTYLLWLSLADTRIDDSALVELKPFTKLQMLNLRRTNVTDAGLVHLAGLTHLVMVDLRDTKVSADGVKNLQQHLPKATILFTGASSDRSNSPDHPKPASTVPVVPIEAPSAPEYRIGRGDLLGISIHELVGPPGLETTKVARVNDGTISLPMLPAPINAVGLTKAELRDRIVERYARAGIHPHAKVSVDVMEVGRATRPTTQPSPSTEATRQAVFAARDFLEELQKMEKAGTRMSPEFVQLKLQAQAEYAEAVRRNAAAELAERFQSFATTRPPGDFHQKEVMIERVALTKRLLEIQQQLVADTQQFFDVIKRRLTVDTTPVQVAQVKAKLESGRTALIDARRDYEDAVFTLVRQLGGKVDVDTRAESPQISISLQGCGAIDDQDLSEFTAISNLRALDLRGTNTTPAAIESLQKQLPKTEILSTPTETRSAPSTQPVGPK